MAHQTEIIVSIGDPTGIGPQLLAYGKCPEKTKLIVYARAQDMPPLPEHVVLSPLPEGPQIEPGKPNKLSAQIAFESLEKAWQHACKKNLPLLTLPVDKSIMAQHDPLFKGHTQWFERQHPGIKTLMTMVSPLWAVGVVTEHIPLRDVANTLSSERIQWCIEILATFLQAHHHRNPLSIAIMGLNPHAGDHGTIGHEEEDTFQLEAWSKDKAYRLDGPFGADSFWGLQKDQSYDGILAMYHDQGLIPAKMRAFDQLVNVSLGLPILRASPGHGPCYDYAAEAKKIRMGSYEAAVALLHQRGSNR